jgi:hypothetical protein
MMTAQPYLPYFKDKRYSIGFQALNERPELAAAVGKCLATWSWVDNELGGLFGILLGTETEAAHRVFLTLRRWSNQRQALDVAAQAALTGDPLKTYGALVLRYNALEAERNDLGHGCFGICPDDQDLLFMIKVEHHIVWQADIIPKLAAGTAGDPHEGLKQKLYVYRLRDLTRLHSKMERMWWDMFYFNGYLRDPQEPRRIAEFRKVFDSLVQEEPTEQNIR